MGVIKLIILLVTLWCGFNVGRTVEAKKLQDNGYMNVNVTDRSGSPIPGYVMCQCNMSGNPQKPGIRFWYQQKAEGEVDEISEGKAVKANRGN